LTDRTQPDKERAMKTIDVQIMRRGKECLANITRIPERMIGYFVDNHCPVPYSGTHIQTKPAPDVEVLLHWTERNEESTTIGDMWQVQFQDVMAGYGQEIPLIYWSNKDAEELWGFRLATESLQDRIAEEEPEDEESPEDEAEPAICPMLQKRCIREQCVAWDEDIHCLVLRYFFDKCSGTE